MEAGELGCFCTIRPAIFVVANVARINNMHNKGVPWNNITVHVGRIATKDELLSCLAEKLSFPDYFGYNWDALYDCLSDLSWLAFRNITIVHDEEFRLPGPELKIYRELLEEAVKSWELSGELTLNVFWQT